MTRKYMSMAKLWVAIVIGFIAGIAIELIYPTKSLGSIDVNIAEDKASGYQMLKITCRDDLSNCIITTDDHGVKNARGI